MSCRVCEFPIISRVRSLCNDLSILSCHEFHASCWTIFRYLSRVGGHLRTITEISSQPEILDPFSSLPGSESFFVDCHFPANASAEDPRPTRRKRPVSLGPWPNRFSFESSIFSHSSSSRRNSLPFQPSSFMSNGTSCRNPSASLSFLQIPRVPRASKGTRKRPASIALSPRVCIYATAPQLDHPAKAEKRYFQPNLLQFSVPQTVRGEPPTQSHSQPPQLRKNSSDTRLLPLIPQSPSISVSIPKDKYHSGSCIAHHITPETKTHEDYCSASTVVPFPSQFQSLSHRGLTKLMMKLLMSLPKGNKMAMIDFRLLSWAKKPLPRLQMHGYFLKIKWRMFRSGWIGGSSALRCWMDA